MDNDRHGKMQGSNIFGTSKVPRVLSLLAICCCLAVGCANGTKPSTQRDVKETTQHLPFERLFSKAPLASGIVMAQIVLIQNEADLDKIRPSIAEIDTDLSGKTDFSKELLIYIATGNQPSTGYSVHVQSVRRTGNEIMVLIREEQPTPQQVVEDAETVPFEVIRLSRSSVAPENGRESLLRLVDEQRNELASVVYSR